MNVNENDQDFPIRSDVDEDDQDEFPVEMQQGVSPHNPRHKYPFKKMKVGDSFFAPVGEGETQASKRGTIWRQAKNHFKAYGLEDTMQVVTRIRSENGVKGVRVWFVAKQDYTSP